MCAPPYQRPELRIVVAVVVHGYVNVVTFAHVAAVLLVKRVARVFKMASDEELAPLARHADAHAAYGRLGDDAQLLMPCYVACGHLRVSALRHVKVVVEAAEDGQQRFLDELAEHAEHLSFKHPLLHAVVEVQPGLRRPADVERAVNVCPRPCEYLSQFRPVVHVLEA